MADLTTKQEFILPIPMATIYGIQDAEGLFYIGSTVRHHETRFKQHLSDVARGKHINARFAERVLSSGSRNCSVTVLDVVPECERYEHEYGWIGKVQADGVRLTNVIKSINQHEYLQNAKRREFLKFVRVLSIYQLNGPRRVIEYADDAFRAELLQSLIESTRRDLRCIFQEETEKYLKQYGEEMYKDGLRYVTDAGVLPLIGVKTALAVVH